MHTDAHKYTHKHSPPYMQLKMQVHASECMTSPAVMEGLCTSTCFSSVPTVTKRFLFSVSADFTDSPLTGRVTDGSIPCRSSLDQDRV